MELEKLVEAAEEKISLGKSLIEELKDLAKVDGVNKVERKIRQEIKFLEKVKNNGKIQISNIMCSNLTYFKSLVFVLRQVRGLKAVDYPIPITNCDKTLRIDIVCDNGATWIKVIARNSKSIKDTVEGKGSYMARSIVDQAEDIVDAAQLNPHLYHAPKVIFQFANEIDAELQANLEEIGVEVRSLHELPTKKEENVTQEIDILNLDVTTLIAYTSNLTNGFSFCEFGDHILNQQAEMERKNPVKPVLDAIFKDKKLICCETAVKSFTDILNFLGGPQEKERAKQFLESISILPDTEETPEEFCDVLITAQVKERSLKIFSFGIVHKAITVTSNEGFYRSVKMQGGLDIPVFLHEARALTELKELKH
ncbi:UPF0415 protein C7orf25 homolog [Culicoides brevitarsis]|uniref:UPF0415 protein C7orf25 homolog n=1 Tax=Culicoides brevitarsis TaxID=469753 RepID=UPI00307C3C34